MSDPFEVQLYTATAAPVVSFLMKVLLVLAATGLMAVAYTVYLCQQWCCKEHKRVEVVVAAATSSLVRKKTMSRRTVATQSQTTYTRHTLQPRFKPLAEHDQGAWCDSMLLAD